MKNIHHKEFESNVNGHSQRKLDANTCVYINLDALSVFKMTITKSSYNPETKKRKRKQNKETNKLTKGNMIQHLSWRFMVRASTLSVISRFVVVVIIVVF